VSRRVPAIRWGLGSRTSPSWTICVPVFVSLIVHVPLMPGQLGQDSKSLGPSLLYKQTFLWIAGEIPILTLYLF
jgi:hypothetical protein